MSPNDLSKSVMYINEIILRLSKKLGMPKVLDRIGIAKLINIIESI